MIIYFVEEIDFFSFLLYNTASYDTFLFWVSLYNSDSRSKIVELNNFDATICPRLICPIFSQVKQIHPTSRLLRISQRACVRNTIGCTLGYFLFAIFLRLLGDQWGMSPNVCPMIHGDILIMQSPTVCDIHAFSRYPSHWVMLHWTLCEDLMLRQLFLSALSHCVPLDLEEIEMVYIVLL